MKRYDCLHAIAEEAGDALVVCTVGGAAAEWNTIRPSDANFRCRTLGLVSSIAMGLALTLTNRQIIGIDGDGALLMNACGLPTLARQHPRNLIHLVFDNGVYEASGLRPTTTAAGADLVAMARGAGLRNATWVSSVDDFKRAFVRAMEQRELSLIAARTTTGPDDLMSWRSLPAFQYGEVENGYRFMRHIEQTEGIPIVPLPGPRH